MSVSVVVGGQFGSEGKGKVAHHLAQERKARAVIRVGGSNSGHTAYDDEGAHHVLRQLPTAALLRDVACVLPAGSYVDPEILLDEIKRLELQPERVLIDPNAVVITAADRAAEAQGDLGSRIGSTCSGTGAAVSKRIARNSRKDLAESEPELRRYLADTHAFAREAIDRGERVIVEGTQGFGLSVLHSSYFPQVTSRDTTAAGAISEAGLSPLDVDEVVLVVRAFPIRVAGSSGPFASEEIDWKKIQEEGGHSSPLAEYTSVTGRLRRVARFDPELVRRAISVNQPTAMVLNHVDYVDAEVGLTGRLTLRARRFARWISTELGRPIDYLGVGPDDMVVPKAETAAA